MSVYIERLSKNTVFRFPKGRKFYVPIRHVTLKRYVGDGYKYVNAVVYVQQYSNNPEEYYALYGTLVNPY